MIGRAKEMDLIVKKVEVEVEWSCTYLTLLYNKLKLLKNTVVKKNIGC